MTVRTAALVGIAVSLIVVACSDGGGSDGPSPRRSRSPRSPKAQRPGPRLRGATGRDGPLRTPGRFHVPNRDAGRLERPPGALHARLWHVPADAVHQPALAS